MPAAQLLDFRLVVVYNGVKATQYFTKFTQESVDVFRSDLLALKLPHPKRENIIFVSHGHIECFWYGAPKDGVLHRNIRDKTQPNTHEGILQLRQRLKDLSIGHILFKIIDPKAESNGSTKRANPYAQKPSNEQEGSRPSKVARTEIAQPPPTVRTRQGIQTVQTPQGIQTVQTPQGIHTVPTPQGVPTVPTPQGVQLPARAVPFPFKKRDLTNEPQGHAQLAINPQRKSSDATTTPTPNTLLTPPDSSGVRHVLASHRPGPRSIHAPRVSLAALQKIPTNENHQKSNLALEEHSGSQGLHTNDGTKQLTAIPKVPLPERKDPAPIVNVPNPQVPMSTQKRVTPTHTLPPKPVASLPRTVTSRFSTITTPATQVPATTNPSSSKQNVPSSLPSRPSSGSVPVPANPAPLASSAGQGMQESEELAVKKEAVRTPSLPGLCEQQRQSRDHMRQNQEEGVSQSLAQPHPQPQPQQPQKGQELGFLRRRRDSRWERDSRPTTSAMVLPTTSSSGGGLTIKTEPGLEPQKAFTPPSEWISPQRVSFDPYNPFEDNNQDQGQNVVPRESTTNGRGTEVNAIPVVVQRNGQVHPPTRPRNANPSSTPRPSGPSAPAPNATDAIAIQRLTREAWGVKRQISANMERERVIIDELEKLGSRWVPEGTMVDSGSNKKRKREGDRVEGGDDVCDGDELHHPKYYEDQKAYNRALVASLEMRLSKAESSLSQTQSKLSQTEAHLLQARAELTDSQAAVVHYHSKLSQAQASLTTLADERRLRKEAEDAIADVRRECIKPFVVPSLLDAFVEVSKVTTRAMVSAQRGTAEDEREKRRREKGKSVDMGPTPLQPQRKAPSLPQSTTTTETKAEDIQPRHGNAGSQSGTSTMATTATTPMNVGEAQSRPGRVDGSLKPPADIRSATASGHQLALLLPTATTEGSSAPPSVVNNIAPEISGDVDMDAAPISTGDCSPRQIPLTQ